MLAPLPGEVELLSQSVSPRAERPGKAGRDGVVERVVAVGLSPEEVAAVFEQRWVNPTPLRRESIGGSTAAMLELRGTRPNGVRVLVLIRNGPAAPLYFGLTRVLPQPTLLPTSVDLAVISPQAPRPDS